MKGTKKVFEAVSHLPQAIKPKALSFPHFPTKMQAFVWRNWEFIPRERLAEVLETDGEHVEKIARGLGLPLPQKCIPNAVEKIHNYLLAENWHLLPYDQILTLLDWTPDRLNYVLKEDDYMFIKLGSLKPECEKLFYRELTREEEIATTNMRQMLADHFHSVDGAEDALAFLNPKSETVSEKCSLTLEQNEVLIDSSWSLEFSSGSETEFTTVFAKNFEMDMKKTFGVEFGKNRNRRIILSIRKDSQLPPESHTLEIAPEKIEICAVDENGILRALQYLFLRMKERSSHVLKCGAFFRRTRIETRIIYPSHCNYSNPFDGEPEETCPDSLLKQFSVNGINGIYFQGILTTLVPWNFAPELAKGYEQRIANLRNIVQRAAYYGIGVYLYINEPRCMPSAFFKEHPEMKGVQQHPDFGDVTNFCTSTEAVKKYIRGQMAKLFTVVPELAGVFTITASENPTSCPSKYLEHLCPRCSKRSPEEIIAEVNTLIAEGVHSVKKNAKIIAWSWGWRSDWQGMLGKARDWAPGIIKRLPDNVTVLVTSEEAMPLCIGGVESTLRDYSIASPGPGKRALALWELAKERGLESGAKIQVNNSWELGSMPYIPALNQVDIHFQNLCSAGVKTLLLSWTMGGYPDSPNMRRLNDYIWDNGSTRFLSGFAESLYGKDAAPKVAASWKLMSDALHHFPHAVSFNYFSSLHLGPANLLFAASSGYRATMVGFPYDDLERWRGAYPEEILVIQLKNLSTEFCHGVEILKNIISPSDIENAEKLEELKSIAEGCFCHFRSVYLQCAFISARNRFYTLLSTNGILRGVRKRKELLNEMLGFLREEIEVAKRLYVLASKDSRLGFESSRQYYYRPRDIQEKVMNCIYLIDFFSKALEDCKNLID